MPGLASKALTFKEHPVATTLFVTCWVNFQIMFFVVSGYSPFRAESFDSIHTVAVQYRGGTTYFFSPAVATYLDVSLWAPIAFALLAIVWSLLATLFRRRAG